MKAKEIKNEVTIPPYVRFTLRNSPTHIFIVEVDSVDMFYEPGHGVAGRVVRSTSPSHSVGMYCSGWSFDPGNLSWKIEPCWEI